MLEPTAARDKATSLVELARERGADAADAVYVGERSQGVSVRLGALEDVHRSEGEEIGLRVFVGKRNATVASSDLSKDALGNLVDRALARQARVMRPFAEKAAAPLRGVARDTAAPLAWQTAAANGGGRPRS